MSRKLAAAPAEKTTQASPASNVPRITKKLPRETDFQRVAKESNLAGVYRIITSNVMVPRPESEWKDEDGKHRPGEPTLELAQPGDEVYLGNEDAMRLLAQDIVEEMNAYPSRVGKVFTPPKVAHNMNAAPGEKAPQYPPPAHGSVI
jgi:hypothetical protein